MFPPNQGKLRQGLEALPQNRLIYLINCSLSSQPNIVVPEAF
jgi:hypothetical protein